jgi:hypothetical protein
MGCDFMESLTRYLAVLEDCGGERTELTKRIRWDREQQWRHVYAARLHAATGKWKWQDYDWHVFSYQHAKALSGAKAVAEYLRLEAPVLIVIPGEHSYPRLPAFQLSATILPDFQGSGLDVLVWPEGLNWTMAFTHEEGWCGPYFSRREWMLPDAD